MPEREQTIEGDKLCHLTGLTDRRHRQLAKEGYFAPPIRGKYQLVRTLQGLFRYYRESQTRRNGTLDEERQRKLTAERKSAELNYEREVEAVIETDIAYKAWEAIILGAKQKLLGLANKIESKHGNDAKLRKILELEIDEICEDLSKPPDYSQSDRPQEPTDEDL